MEGKGQVPCRGYKARLAIIAGIREKMQSRAVCGGYGI